MSEFRTETDSLGDVQVPADALWGATLNTFYFIIIFYKKKSCLSQPNPRTQIQDPEVRYC